PIKRKRLVIAARHQALDHVAADRRRCDALYDERIEAVEGAEHALYQAAALGCGGGWRGGRGGAPRRRAPPPPGRWRGGPPGAGASRSGPAPPQTARPISKVLQAAP